MGEIDVNSSLLEPNDILAAQNRELLSARGIYMINLMSAPGAGKTSLLERVLPPLVARHRVAVIEGDIVGLEDACRIDRLGVPVRQVNTGAECHLDARMIRERVEELVAGDPDALFIENVGNLVCPAEFDLGEDNAVMLLSVTEGHDKPKKYPLMFRRADLLIINKIDLLPYTDFDLYAAESAARDIHPGIEIITTSCRTGAGLDQLVAWLEQRIVRKRAVRPEAVS